MSSKVRIAVAGAGLFGREHLKAIARNDGVALVGVADANPDAARQAAEQYGAGEWADDAIALVDRVRPDGLIIATPGATHVQIALAALERGIPLLLEKPVAPTAPEARALAEAEARSAGFVLPGHVLRHCNDHRRLAAIAHSPTIGRILSVTARRHRDESHATRYRDDPILMTMIHDIDLALWISGGPPTEIWASRLPAGTTRSDTMMTGRSADGPIWRLSTAWTLPGNSQPPDRIEIVGENGAVDLEVGGAIRVYARDASVMDISTSDPDQPLNAESAYFAACIRDGRKPTVVTLADAINGLAVADAVARSIETGAVIAVKS